MEPDSSPRKIQFTVPLLEPHLDPEAAEQIRRRRPTPATLVLTSDQSSPEIDEDRIPNPLLKSSLAMSPRQRKKMTRTTPTMKELQTMVEHHLGQQKQGEEPEGAAESTGTQESCPPGISGTGAESRLGASETAQKPAGSIPKSQKGSEEPSTEKPSTHIPPLDSQAANSLIEAGPRFHLITDIWNPERDSSSLPAPVPGGGGTEELPF
ncbi:protein phosphatase 1 regulatory subunit 1A [Ctenodactylus gundi]